MLFRTEGLLISFSLDERVLLSAVCVIAPKILLVKLLIKEKFIALPVLFRVRKSDSANVSECERVCANVARMCESAW